MMRILLLRHYPPVEGPSMRAFADQIAAGLRGRGYRVQEITATVLLGRIPSTSNVATKWLGYCDQFLIFPPWLWLRVHLLPRDSLCVLADQALGPWMPWLGCRPHIVHCHDLLALDAALGLQPFHRMGRSGRWYQHWIRRGFRRAACFLSVSAATQKSLNRHLLNRPSLSAVVYNPLSSRFAVLCRDEAVSRLSALPGMDQQPFLLHIGCTWYKNRRGVMAIWEQLYRLGFAQHLVLVGALDTAIQAWLDLRPHLQPLLHVFNYASDDIVVALYNRASALLFPSHAEGFGWPILEALACGCPVITTNRPPMTEVGGEAITTIPPAPSPPEPLDTWALESADQVQKVLTRSVAEQERVRQLGFAQARRFQYETWLDQLEIHYQQALALQQRRRCAA